MAIWQECDRCGATTRDTRGELWGVATLSVGKGKSNSYDLCPRCYQETKVLLTGKRELSPEQQAVLNEIWDNAQKFDQSIGEIGR